jgi:rhomboid protease GluP
MDKINFNEIEYFERVPSSEERKFGLKAVDRFTPVDLKGDPLNIPILLKPISRKFENRVGNKLYWIFGSFGIVTTIFLLLLIWPNFSASAHKKFLSGKGKTKDDFSDFLEFFIPKKDRFITAIILDVNIFVFILMWFYNYQSFLSRHLQLLHWGANRRFEVLDGEWWRLVTNIFLHGGIIHLIYNCISFVLVAILLEPILGRIKFLIYYIICGILASVVSIIYYDNIISVGASGAIFGLFGILIYSEVLFTKKHGVNSIILYYFGAYVAINLIYGLIVPGIDNAAHFGGLIAGLLMGYLNTILDSKDEFNVTKNNKRSS